MKLILPAFLLVGCDLEGLVDEVEAAIDDTGSSDSVVVDNPRAGSGIAGAVDVPTTDGELPFVADDTDGPDRPLFEEGLELDDFFEVGDAISMAVDREDWVALKAPMPDEGDLVELAVVLECDGTSKAATAVLRDEELNPLSDPIACGSELVVPVKGGAYLLIDVAFDSSAEADAITSWTLMVSS